MKPFPTQMDLKDCRLIDVSSGEILLTFDAQTTVGRSIDAGYIGNGINSGGQSMSIATQEKFSYKPYAHQVVIDNITYLLVAVRLSPFIKTGRSFSRAKHNYILELQ